MKYFQPKSMKPHTNQFYAAVKDKISTEGQKSLAYKAVHGLFVQAQSLYQKLDFVTSENISHFKTSGKYLTQRQEHDAVALTAMYVSDLRTNLVHDLVKEDTTITESERQILEMALEIYKATSEANYSALGNPRWIDD
jgi:hypothetical protein